MSVSQKRSLFDEFRGIAYERAGIKLAEGKESLVSARVAKRVRALGLTDESQYLEVLKSDSSDNELVKFLDVISTNFTNFFREPDHFEFLSDLVKQWIAAGSTDIRIWCAAASSGEEPYTIAFTVLEALGNSTVDVKILATDISTQVLAKARAGVYGEKSLEPVPEKMRVKYFTRTGEVAQNGEKLFQVNPAVRKLIHFGRLNLATPPYPMNGPFDMVLCRNVMIYFDTPIRQGLATEVERLLKPGAYLLTGHSETLSGVVSRLKTVKPSIYQKHVQQ